MIKPPDLFSPGKSGETARASTTRVFLVTNIKTRYQRTRVTRRLAFEKKSDLTRTS